MSRQIQNFGPEARMLKDVHIGSPVFFRPLCFSSASANVQAIGDRQKQNEFPKPLAIPVLSVRNSHAGQEDAHLAIQSGVHRRFPGRGRTQVLQWCPLCSCEACTADDGTSTLPAKARTTSSASACACVRGGTLVRARHWVVANATMYGVQSLLPPRDGRCTRVREPALRL